MHRFEQQIHHEHEQIQSQQFYQSINTDIIAAYRPSNALNLPVPTRRQVPGEVFVIGQGDCGQLGLGTDVLEAEKPRKIQSLIGVVDIACGGLHSLALTEDGKVYSWGCNDHRALGRDGPETEVGLVQGLEGIDVVKIGAGDNISCALDRNGKLYVWGTFRDEQGVYGFLPGIQIQPVAALFLPLSQMTIVDFACGTDHVVALNSYGIVYAWGIASQLRLGRTPIGRQAERHSSLIPDRIPLRRIVKIGAGAYHSIAIDIDGRSYVWGLNNFGQCAADGDESNVFPPRLLELPEGMILADATGGEHHSLGLTSTGQVLAWGRSDSHQLGLGYTKLPSTNISISSSTSPDSASKSLITVPQLNPHLSQISSISSFSHFSSAVTQDGTCHTWGYGEYFQLGNRIAQDEPIPFKIPLSEGTQILKAEVGGQHTVLLALRTQNVASEGGQSQSQGQVNGSSGKEAGGRGRRKR
ncbi:regulator of chromosome condensation 1/beta-lactamase-inhibitor protein II [Paraphysoderma sedebokerense]|nr:regulator of chromosome condensation 1/beta-lactamase-inhibitor protein II [Paraphysoderma sedebokerense]